MRPSMHPSMHPSATAPEEQWMRAFDHSVCHSCRQAFPAGPADGGDVFVCHSCRQAFPAGPGDGGDVFVCPACAQDLTEQARQWLGMPGEAGEGEY